jgi:cell division septal protein FtsQ
MYLPDQKNLLNRKFKKKGKLLYNSKNYSNPYFGIKNNKKNKPSNPFLPTRLKLISLSLIAMFTGLVWFLFFSGFFNIKSISATGEGRLDANDLENIAWIQANQGYFVFIKQKNIFLFSGGNLLKNLKEKYSFENIILKKKFPNSILINYKEKNYSMLWLENNNYYFGDEYGYIISPANAEEVKQKKYPLIENQSDSKITDNKITLDRIYINYIFNLTNKFKNLNNDFKIKNFLLDNEMYTVKMALENGPIILFNLEEDVDKQIEKLKIIKGEKLKQDFNKKTYIDIRYGDRVYYR